MAERLYTAVLMMPRTEFFRAESPQEAAAMIHARMQAYNRSLSEQDFKCFVLAILPQDEPEAQVA